MYEAINDKYYRRESELLSQKQQLLNSLHNARQKIKEIQHAEKRVCWLLLASLLGNLYALAALYAGLYF